MRDKASGTLPLNMDSAEFELIEIGPWWWSWATEEQKENHRMMNPFFVPRIVKVRKELEAKPDAS